MANRGKINKDYPEFDDYKKKFKVDNAMIEDLKKVAEQKEVEWDEEQYKRSEDWIKLRIKALIAQNLWNIDKFYRIVYEDDKMIQKAVKVLNSKKEYDRLLGK